MKKYIEIDFAERCNSRLPVSVICKLDFKQTEEILRQIGEYFQEFQFNDK